MYTKTDWSTAKITPENLNKMQTQYQKAVEAALGMRLGNKIIVQHVSDFPPHEPGKPKIIYHTGLKMFFFSTGSEWHLEPKMASFGNATLGDFYSTEDVIFTNSIGQTVVRNYRNFTLNTDHLLTTENPAHALVIRAWGNITIDGTIDMSEKGGFGNRYVTLFGQQFDLLGGDGGNGGNGAGGSGGLGGTTDANEDCAGGRRGGGGGGASDGGDGGNGGPKNTKAEPGDSSGSGHAIATAFDRETVLADGEDGTIGSGGGGGASAVGGFNNSVLRAVGGEGGLTRIGNIPTGSGGGGGAAYIFEEDKTLQAENGESGKLGGGVVVLMALGSITINGQILAKGGKGGDGGLGYSQTGSTPSVGRNGGGGGGSGGGKVLLVHRRGYNFAGNYDVSGGLGGESPSQGTPGEDGQPGANGDIEVVQFS